MLLTAQISNPDRLNRASLFSSNATSTENSHNLNLKKKLAHKNIILFIVFILISGILTTFSLLTGNGPVSKSLRNDRLTGQNIQTTTPGAGSQITSSTASGPDSSGTAGTNTTKVTVNGQPINIPDNGNFSQSVDNGNSQTDINVNSEHSSTTNGSSSSSNTSSTTVNVNSSSN